jgi:hypothetical protein
MANYSNMKGVQGQFLLGSPVGLVRLRSVGGVFQTRNNADTGFTDLYAGLVRANDPTVGLFDDGAIIANGKIRDNAGVQSYGSGTGGVIGAARGGDASDLQTTRLLANQVASGQGSQVLGGENSKASGKDSVAFGSGASAIGARGVAIGEGCVSNAGAVGAIAMGLSASAITGATAAVGSATIASARSAVALGASTKADGSETLAAGSETSVLPAGGLGGVALGRRSLSLHNGTMAFAGGRIAANGDSESTYATWGRRTTNAAATNLRLDPNLAGSDFTPLAGTAYGFEILAVAELAGGGAGAVFRVRGMFRRVGGVPAFVGGAPAVTTVAIDAALVGIVFAVGFSGTSFVPTGTGLAATTINWTASGKMTRNV